MHMSKLKYLPLLGALFVLVIGGACAEGSSETPPGGAGGVGGMGGCDAAAPDLCNEECVDTQTDGRHCGECDHNCGPIDICVGGECVDCEAGFFACEGECIDISNDPENCGGCGVACPDGRTCEGYQCRCLDDKTLCGDECVNLESDADHCGDCDIACEAGDVCFNSECDHDCGTLLECGRDCVDPLTSNDHCGFCNHECIPGAEECQGGTCQCVPGLCGACGVVDLGATVPQTVSGNTNGAPDFLTPGCAGGGSGEKAYLFEAPTTDTYAFVVNTGGFFSPVLSLRDTSSCSEIQCASDSGFFGQAQLVRDMVAGEQVMVVVDGEFGGTGNFQLQIDVAPPCPAIVLGSTLPQVVTGNNAGVPDFIDPFCTFGGDGGEITYEFTAPTTGPYLFAVDTAFSFTAVVEIREDDCAGASIACDEGFPAAGTAVNMVAGETVVVIVDSNFGGGNYTLTVDLAPPCPGTVLPSTIPQVITGNNAASIDQFTPYCNATGEGEDTYQFTAPATGSYSISVDTGFSFQPVIDVRNGSCIGPSLGCDFGGFTQAVQFDLTLGQTVVFAVDSTFGGGPYTLNLDQAPACPEIVLSGPLPINVSGDNTSTPNLHDPNCAFNNSNEITYLFTAPSTNLYSFSMNSMFFTPIIEVRNGGSCGGFPLSCEFGSFTGTANANVNLVAGQQVVIIADGDFGGVGPFDLSVDIAPPCPGVNLGTTSPQTVMGTTSGTSSFFSGNCSFGSEFSPEDTYLFTAPANGTYTFDTLGSAFDTVLYAHTVDCGGAELICNDDDFMSGTSQSKFAISLLTGQSIAIFVDGNFGDLGNYVLNVSGP
jgi:hypothetical protein